MKKSVSIIIACYNEEAHIRLCLETLLKQNYKPLEIIVIDDGSTDRTQRIVEQFKNIRYSQLQHQGTALARNFGANQSKGNILVFVDADMEFPTDFISHLVEPINVEGKKGTFSLLEYVKNWDKPLSRCWNKNSNPRLPDRLRVLQQQKSGEDFRAIVKSEFLKVSGFDNTGYTDTWSLAKKLGYKPQNAANALYYHNNPETYNEVFQSARWIGKRQYKLGKLGTLFAIIRSFFLFSLIKGAYKLFRYHETAFIPFQIVYDWGITLGAIDKIVFGSVSK